MQFSLCQEMRKVINNDLEDFCAGMELVDLLIILKTSLESGLK